jgi:hypothetical protein
MSERGSIVGQKQDSLIWEGLGVFADLPGWLAFARDPERLRTALSQSIPEFNSGQLILHQCKADYIRYKTEYWTGFFELSVSAQGAAEQYQVDLQGILYPWGGIADRPFTIEDALGSKTWHAVLPAFNLELWTKLPEAVLSSLAMLTDPEQSRQYLMRSIRAGSPAYRDLYIQTCQPKIVRYKPGSRCTIVYQLGYPPSSPAQPQRWPDLVVAKTYRKEKGQHAYESMRAFWDSGLAGNPLVKIAEPLAYDPELKVMVQGPIRQERTLKDLTVAAVIAGTQSAKDELADGMRKTARGLAALHQSGTKLDNVYGWENDMAEVCEFIDRLSTAVPGLAQAAYPLVDRLASLEASSTSDALVPSHGTFRPAQVLMDHGEIGFIDFDSCCNAEPAKDLGLFLCAFMRAGMATVDFDDIAVNTGPLDDAARLARFEWLAAISGQFLDEYESSAHPVNRQRVALFEALEIFTLILHAWMKVKVRELKDILYLLQRFLISSKILELQ